MLRKIRNYIDRRKQKRRICQHCGNKENDNQGKVMFGKYQDPVKPKRYWHERCYSIAFHNGTPNFEPGGIPRE